ncbi:MAG: hypothetical protein ACRC2R_17970 [Xenococcaceae cyanobacterium]
MNRLTRQVTRNKRAIELTANEFELLEYLNQAKKINAQNIQS